MRTVVSIGEQHVEDLFYIIKNSSEVFCGWKWEWNKLITKQGQEIKSICVKLILWEVLQEKNINVRLWFIPWKSYIIHGILFSLPHDIVEYLYVE